ncbi:hypothetical protein WOQ_01361 [Enterococcus faecalis EnGen0340]|nr:hypothetical protein WOQ_01361 [Enterococcus faecalis EnGen0340]
MNKKINWRRQLTQLEKQTLTELKNKEMIKQGTFYKLEQTFPEESAYTYYGLYILIMVYTGRNKPYKRIS